MRWDFLAILTSKIGLPDKSDNLKERSSKCLNCDYVSTKEPFRFCPSCGQKARDSKITFKSLIGEMLSNVFNFDSSLYKTAKWLPKPAYLSKRYIKGERKQFLNPIRFFFFSMLIFFALLSTVLNSTEIEKSNILEYTKIERSETLEEFNQVIDRNRHLIQDSVIIDSIRNALFKGVRIPSLDSVAGIKFSQESTLNFETVNNLTRRETFLVPIDSLDLNLKSNSWIENLLSVQVLRADRNRAGAINFMIGNLIWVVVSTILIVAVFMKLIYFRRKNYVIEHAILLFHTHSFIFALGIIFLLTLKVSNNPQLGTTVSSVLSLVGIIYLVLSIKSFYSQGWIKTILKFALITLIYFFVMSILMLIVFLVSLLFF